MARARAHRRFKNFAARRAADGARAGGGGGGAMPTPYLGHYYASSAFFLASACSTYYLSLLTSSLQHSTNASSARRAKASLPPGENSGARAHRCAARGGALRCARVTAAAATCRGLAWRFASYHCLA